MDYLLDITENTWMGGSGEKPRKVWHVTPGVVKILPSLGGIFSPDLV